MRHVTDGWWADQEELGGAIARAGGVAEDEAGQDSCACGDFPRGDVEDGLQVIGAEHEDDEVDRLVALQAGRQVVEAFAGDVEGVLMHGGASVLALFNDAVIRS